MHKRSPCKSKQIKEALLCQSKYPPNHLVVDPSIHARFFLKLGYETICTLRNEKDQCCSIQNHTDVLGYFPHFFTFNLVNLSLLSKVGIYCIILWRFFIFSLFQAIKLIRISKIVFNLNQKKKSTLPKDKSVLNQKVDQLSIFGQIFCGREPNLWEFRSHLPSSLAETSTWVVH